jgi:predicted AAA+ superfamily ATPase
LEKGFVLFRLPPFSRNLRKEISKKQKIYFYDVGIRNSIIQQYQPLHLRENRGSLWENFLLVERLKYLQLLQLRPNHYFWRTHDGQEIDYLEERDGQLHAYEFKWSPRKKRKVPAAFAKAYPTATMEWIDNEHFTGFVEDESLLES